MDSNRDYARYAPQNSFTWPACVVISLALALVAVGALFGLYASRSEDVSLPYLAVLGVLFWLTFFGGSGVDKRLPQRARGFTAFVSTRVGFVAIAIAALGGILF